MLHGITNSGLRTRLIKGTFRIIIYIVCGNYTQKISLLIFEVGVDLKLILLAECIKISLCSWKRQLLTLIAVLDRSGVLNLNSRPARLMV